MRLNFTRAQQWARDLGRERVTPTEKRLIVAISDYWDPRFHSANVALSTLVLDTLIDRRYIARLLNKLCHLVEYTPGRGAGNFGCFVFPELPVEKPVENNEDRWQKDGNNMVSNKERKKDLNLDQVQNRESKSPARYSQRDFDERDLRLMGQALRKLMDKPHPERSPLITSMSDAEALAFQCEFAGITVDRGEFLLQRTRKKQVQSA